MNEQEKAVIRHLFKVKTATRTEIAEALGIRKNTVGAICNKLLDTHYLLENNEAWQRKIPVTVNPEFGYAAGVEHRIDQLVIVILNAAGARIFEKKMDLKEVDESNRLNTILRQIKSALDQAGGGVSKLLSIGFSDFVPHDIGDGFHMRSIWMPHWGAVNLKDKLYHEFRFLPCIMRCTDARAAAEWAYGSAGSLETFLEVQLDEGIGLSVFKNGDFLKGSTDIFGEIGHTLYKMDGELCKCGNRGCLETVAGVSSIERTYSMAAEKGIGNQTASLQDITVSALEGDKTANLVLKEAAEAIGYTLANTVNILGVLDIFLYGPLTAADRIIKYHIQDALNMRCLYPLNQAVKVRVSGLDDFSTAAGAAWYGLKGWYIKP